MNYRINTTTWSDNEKLYLLQKIMEETGLRLRWHSSWVKNVNGLYAEDGDFDFPNNPYLELNCFNEDNVCIRKMTNMTEANREGLRKIVDDIIIHVLENEEVVNG